MRDMVTHQWILFVAPTRSTPTLYKLYWISNVDHTCRSSSDRRQNHIFVENRDFYRATRMHSTDYAVTRCLSVSLSVCPSVHHTPVLCLNDYTYPQSFVRQRVAPLFSFFHTKRDGNIPTGTPERKRRMQGGMKKSRFSTNISIYLANDARQSLSYHERQIGNRTLAFEWYRFEWPWVTSNPDFKVTILFNDK